MQDKSTQQETPQIAQVDIGALLSSQRESLGASVKMAAKAVNLSLETLEYLESNQFAKIGTAVYVRGYLGLYAKYLGLDAAQIIHIYDSQYPAQTISIKPALAQPLGNKKQSKRHSKTLSLLFALGVFGGLLYGYNRLEPLFFDSDSKNNYQSDMNVTISDDSPVQTIVNEVEGAQSIANDALNGLPVTNQSSGLVSELTLSSIDFDDTLANTATENKPTPENNLQSDGVTEQTTVEQESLETQSISEEEVAPEEQALQLQFKNDCWLKITDANGNVLASGVYSTKRPVDIKGKAPFKLTTARQEAIKVISLNGEAITLGNYRVSNRRYEIK